MLPYSRRGSPRPKSPFVWRGFDRRWINCREIFTRNRFEAIANDGRRISSRQLNSSIKGRLALRGARRPASIFGPFSAAFKPFLRLSTAFTAARANHACEADCLLQDRLRMSRRVKPVHARPRALARNRTARFGRAMPRRRSGASRRTANRRTRRACRVSSVCLISHPATISPFSINGGSRRSRLRLSAPIRRSACTKGNIGRPPGRGHEDAPARLCKAAQVAQIGRLAFTAGAKLPVTRRLPAKRAAKRKASYL
jgi:hypothetical protein